MPLSAEMMSLYENAFGQSLTAMSASNNLAAERQRDHSAGAIARQTDGAAFDNRVLGAAIASGILLADDPEKNAAQNAAIRVPTTLDHPGIPAVK